MDLGAYSQIPNLSVVASKNNIVVPRLRGYRLMKSQEPAIVTDDFIKTITIDVIKDLVECGWKQGGSWRYRVRVAKEHKYLISQDPTKPNIYTDIRWDRLSGRKRRMIKTEVRNQLNLYKQQYNMFNKYIGRDDILYVHARIGSGNWPAYRDEVVNQPWFLEKIDDAFDPTYCDIYAKIDPNTYEVIADG